MADSTPTSTTGATAGKKVVAVKGANVIAMNGEKVDAGYTVVVSDGVITAVGPVASTSIPTGAELIDGQGKWLVPGLMDLHVHMMMGNWEEERQLYIATGMTTIRNMSGTAEYLKARDAVKGGTTAGPRIFTAGPIINGVTAPGVPMVRVTTAEEGTRAVDQQYAAGYDFIKIYDRLSPAAFKAVLTSAVGYGLTVAGHTQKGPGIGIDDVIDDGRQLVIEHLTEYEAPDPPGPAERAREGKTVAKGIWNCATLGVYWTQGNLPAIKANEPDFVKYAPAAKRQQWRTSEQKERPYAYDEYMALLKRLNGIGAKLIAGTDTYTAYTVPGFSLHEELARIVRAGMTPYRALEMATADGSRFLSEAMHIPDDSGRIAVGKRGDLVLLKASPLADIRNTRQIAGVVLKGEYYSEAKIGQMLAGIEAKYK